MEKKFTQYDSLRYEFFENLLPQMIYQGSQEEKDYMLNELKEHGTEFIHYLFNVLCEEDGLEYPYDEKHDFEVKTIERGGAEMIQINMPDFNENINDILRTYLLFYEGDGEKQFRKYFVIKRFVKEKTVRVLYVSPEIEKYLGEDLTAHEGDMEYEIWKVVCDCAMIVVKEIGKDKK